MQPRAIHRGLSVALLAALSGCGAAVSTGTPGGSTESAPQAAPITNLSVDADTRLTLSRSACYGSCPVYSLTLAGDGTVTYEGKAFVRVQGPASGQVSVSAVQALVDRMLRADYFNLSVPASCPTGFVSDAAGASTSLSLGGRTHAVPEDGGNTCTPAVLYELEDAIDTVAESDRWVHCDTNGGACCDPMHGNPLFPCN